MKNEVITNNFFATFCIESNLHAFNTVNTGYSVVKDYLTTDKNYFIYNNMSCKGLLDNWGLGESRG